MNMKRILPLLLIAFASAAYAGGDELRQSTATQIDLLMLDGTDGVSAETTLTVTEWDCDLVKHADSGMTNTALTITASGGSNDAAHLTAGMYSLELTATDTNTAGRLTVNCRHSTTANTFVPVSRKFMVLTQNFYDSKYSTDELHVDVIQVGGTSEDLPTATELATAQADLDTITGSDGVTLATTQGNYAPATAAALATTDGVADNILSYIQTNLGLLGANATEAGGDGDHLTEAGGTGDQFTGMGWIASWDAEVQSEVTDALNAYDPPTNTEMTTAIDALPTAAENATEHLTQQRVLTGTCDSGSTTTCVDDALTQASTSQLDDRLICFSDSWCALITDFTPGTDTVTTTKVAPSTRSTLGYTIFPATAQ